MRYFVQGFSNGVWDDYAAFSQEKDALDYCESLKTKHGWNWRVVTKAEKLTIIYKN